MKFYSSSHRTQKVQLKEAIIHSEAPDGGLFMPDGVKKIPQAFLNNIAEMSAVEISYFIANTLFGPDIPSDVIKKIGEETFNFPMPLVEIEPNIYAYELFHGPTHSVKDVGTRFLARLLVALNSGQKTKLRLLLATNGNSGSAITNGFYGVDGIEVYVLYPKTTPPTLAAQFTQLGKNIHAIRINGTIDDCRSLAATALSDTRLNDTMQFTSANTVNIGRVLPQVICYFQAYAQLKAKNEKVAAPWISVPCGNAGNLFAGHIARQMGLPIERLVAACNANAAMVHYLENGLLDPAAVTQRTLAYALDNAHPANIRRFDDVCHGDVSRLRQYIVAESCDDAQIYSTIEDMYARHGYIIGPHTAISYHCLKRVLPQGVPGIFLATAHPSRSAGTVRKILGDNVVIPDNRTAATNATVKNHEIRMAPTYPALRKYLLQSIE